MSWDVKNLSEIFPLIRNGASIKQDDNSNGIPITRIETIANGEIDNSRLGYANIESEKYAEYYLQDGDILMSHINSWAHLGKTAIAKSVNSKIIHGMNLLLLRAAKDLVTPEYGKYFFETLLFKRQLNKISNQSVNQSSFSISKLRHLEIPLPPLSIQRLVADVLDKADALRKKDQQLLKYYDDLAQSLFIEMFGDPVRNEKGWEVGTIRDLSREVKYGTSKPALEDGETPYLRMNNITYSGEWNFNDLKHITLEDKEKEKYCLKKGDIVFNRTNSKELVGKTAVYNLGDEMAIAGYLIRLRVNELASPTYICSFLNSKYGKATLKNMCKNIIGMANINAQELQNINIPIPPIALQNQFATQIQNIEQQKEKVKAQLQASENLFQALLQKAFNGSLN